MSGLQLTTSQRLPALLLAVTALWALIFAIAGFAGLAGRYRLHPDDPSRVPPLAAVDLSQARSPLKSVENYADIGERPLFNPDRRPLPPEEEALGDDKGEGQAPVEAMPLDVALTSVILTPKMQIAIITDNRSGKSVSVRVGDALEGEQSAWQLKELGPRKAVFAGPSGNASVDLRVFDGAGGQAPTPALVDKHEVGSSDSPMQPGQSEQAEPAPEPVAGEAMTPEQRSEMIRRRIEDRRRQMREEAERANKK